MEGYRLFRKDKPGRQGGGVAIYETAAGVHAGLPGDG